MTDAVLIDLAARVFPAVEVVFIDTGYHFQETLDTVEVVRRRYGLNLRIMTVATHAEELWRSDPENCCSAVKVGQLDRALAGKAAWMSGLRRDEATSRAGAPFISRDLARRRCAKIELADPTTSSPETRRNEPARSSPVIFGSMTSRIMMSGESSRARSRPASPSRAKWAPAPSVC